MHLGKRSAQIACRAAALMLAAGLCGCAADLGLGDHTLHDLVAPFEQTSKVNRYTNYDENGNAVGYWLDEYTLEGRLTDRKLCGDDGQLLREERFSYPDRYTTRIEVYDGEGVLGEVQEKRFDPAITENPNLPAEERFYGPNGELVKRLEYGIVDQGDNCWVYVAYGEEYREDGIRSVWREKFNGEYPVTAYGAEYENDVLRTEFFYNDDGVLDFYRLYNDDGSYTDAKP